MARSSYIYTVIHPAPLNPDPPHVVACFTVKHEAKTWCQKCGHDDIGGYEVWRFADSPSYIAGCASPPICYGSVQSFVDGA